jgi:CRP/FNR family transcriptional regulator, cyclic AMP receptor protein
MRARFGEFTRAKVAAMAFKRKTSFNPKTFLAEFGEGRTIGKYRKDQVIFSQGETANTIFYIQKGGVKLTVLSEQGKEAVVAVLETDNFFGETCLNGASRRLSTATTATDAVIMKIERTTMIRAIHEEPKFAEMFITHLLDRTVRVEADLVDQLFNSSEKRLARMLLILAHVGKQENSEMIVPKINQETLAEMIGTTRARVSYFMNKFRKLGLIDYNGGIKVHRSLLNVVLHDQPEIRT